MTSEQVDPNAPVSIRLSELLGALSHALDITEGQPEGHSIRACCIGMGIGRELGLADDDLWELYYTLLLKDLGCSSNAARLSALYKADDLAFKREFKFIEGGKAQLAPFVMRHAGARRGPATRVAAVLDAFKNGGDYGRELIDTRCHRGAEIARQLGFSEPVAQGVRHLDEHWDGGGGPTGAQGEAIPLYARIALLSQVAEVFHAAGGPSASLKEVSRRSGGWLDPGLVGAFARAQARRGFWEAATSPSLADDLLRLEPASRSMLLDEDGMDRVATAFGAVIDAKSPFTAGHSGRVADVAEQVGAALGLSPGRRRWLRRGALLHDIGKLGVSNTLLDKPGPLSDAEWVLMRRHAGSTQAILGRIGAFAELARISAAHHERLDGRGYPLGLRDAQLSLETRIITTADIYDALTADRPYRAAMPQEGAFSVMDEMVGTALDPACLDALKTAVQGQADRQAA